MDFQCGVVNIQRNAQNTDILKNNVEEKSHLFSTYHLFLAKFGRHKNTCADFLIDQLCCVISHSRSN